MKNLVFTFFLSAVVFAFAPASAQAQEYGFYLTPKVFYSHLEADVNSFGDYNDNVGGGALAIGYDFNTQCYAPIRLELEFAMRGKGKHDVTGLWGYPVKGDLKVSVTSLFANAFYDFHNQSDFTPYIGGGLGAARIKGETKLSYGGYKYSGSRSEWDFAWNVGAGVAYKLTDFASLDLGYRYADFGTLTEDGDDIMDVTGHEVLLGVRFTF